MIAVVGRRRDPLAQSLVERWRSHDAALLTVRDLSRAGWRHDPFAPLCGRAVIDGRAVAVSELAAVITTLESVTIYDLPHIVREDRDYVAAEMRAFLMAWLTTLPCPVLNRPTPLSLAGCGWRRERWRLAAAELRIPAVAVREPSAGADTVAADGTDAMATVTLVGDTVLDAPDELVAEWVRRLAAAAGTSTLLACFGAGHPARLLSANALPDLTRPEVAAAALDWLERGGS